MEEIGEVRTQLKLIYLGDCGLVGNDLIEFRECPWNLTSLFLSSMGLIKAVITLATIKNYLGNKNLHSKISKIWIFVKKV